MAMVTVLSSGSDHDLERQSQVTPARRRRERWTNVSTGEVNEFEREEGRPAYNLGGSFHQISDRRTLAMIRQEGGLTHTDLAVFLFFALAEREAQACTETDGAAYLDMSVKEVALDIGMHSDAVGRIVRKLKKVDLLLETRRVGRVIYYRASPHVIFRGTGAEQQAQAKNYRLPSVPGMYDADKIRRVQ
jgi:DNA-binding transcriptional ArsR family regulator